MRGPLEWSEADDMWAAAVLLHPHPDMGGDRFNPVVDALFRRLPPAGIGAARFDFSSSDPGDAAADVRTAIDAVVGQHFTGPLVVAGYSFGADIATTVDDERLAGWFLVAPPLRVVGEHDMRIAGDERPKALAVPEHDQFSPPERARRLTEGWANTTVDVVAGADHFLGGSTGEVATLALAWMEALLRPSRPT